MCLHSLVRKSVKEGGEMAQWVRASSVKAKEAQLDPQHPFKSLTWLFVPIISVGNGRDKEGADIPFGCSWTH